MDKRKVYRQRYNEKRSYLTEDTCSNCGKIKPINQFFSGGRKCKSCHAKTTKAWRENNLEHWKAVNKIWNDNDYQSKKEFHRARRLKRQLEDPIGYMLQRCQYSAKTRKLEFNLTRNDLVMPTHCPLLGIKLDITARKTGSSGKMLPADNSPSVDRIDNTKGYVPGNVRIISHKANQTKGNLSLEELKMFATNLAKYLCNE